MRVAIIRLDTGNYGSLIAAIRRLQIHPLLWSSAEDIKPVDWVILPGVGALNNLYGRLQQRGFLEGLADLKVKGTRFLGICLGLQAFFGDGEEGGHGLGWLEGTVPRLGAQTLPHIGFNTVNTTETSPAWLKEFDSVPFYFVHSYRVQPTDSSYVAATTLYHEEFPSVIVAPALYGVQFHPELSGPVGDRFFQKLFASGT